MTSLKGKNIFYYYYYPLQRIKKKEEKRIMNNFDYRFIDGEGYFASVADAIKKAKEEIFITDWWYIFPFCYISL